MTNLIPRVEFFIQSFFRRQKSCPFCASEDSGIIAAKYRQIRIRRCSRCRLCFTDPIYKPFFNEHFYDSFYKAEGITTTMPDAKTLEELKRVNFSTTDKYYAAQLEILSRESRGRDLLEIGSSWGYFLYQAKRAAFNAQGIEPADKRRRYGIDHLGVEIYRDFNEIGPKKFDVVFVGHVLEHFTDLSTIFSDIFSSLKPAGLLYIEVPNFDFDQFGAACLNVIGAVHPLGFSSEFFHLNLPKIGFKEVRIYESVEAISLGRPVQRSSASVLAVMARK